MYKDTIGNKYEEYDDNSVTEAQDESYPDNQETKENIKKHKGASYTRREDATYPGFSFYNRPRHSMEKEGHSFVNKDGFKKNDVNDNYRRYLISQNLNSGRRRYGVLPVH